MLTKMETTNTNKYKIIEGRMVDTEPKPKGWKGEYTGKGFKMETKRARRILFWVNMEELVYLTETVDIELHPKLKTHFKNRIIKYKDVIEELNEIPTPSRGRPSRKHPSEDTKSTDFEEDIESLKIKKQYKTVKNEIENLEQTDESHQKGKEKRARQKKQTHEVYEKTKMKRTLVSENVEEERKMKLREYGRQRYARKKAEREESLYMVIEPLWKWCCNS